MKLLAVAVASTIVVGGFALASHRRAEPGVPAFSYIGERSTPKDLEALATNGWRLVRLDDAGEPTLYGIVRTPVDGEPLLETPRKYFVHFPGNGEAVVAEAKALFDTLELDESWGILCVVPRGFDASNGDASRAGLERDADRVERYASTVLDVDWKHSVLSGFSLGAYFAARAATKTTPSALVLWAPIAEIDIGQTNFRSRFRPFDRYRTLEFLARIQTPTLVISGDVDHALDLTHPKRVVTGLGKWATWVRVPNAGHSEVARTPTAVEAARVFVRTPGTKEPSTRAPKSKPGDTTP